jgi:ring-1,2-phenylacetyl-CoA epoxidase subunit PaaD
VVRPDSSPSHPPLLDRAAHARALLAELPDPEIPVLTLEDLGILREVREQEGRLTVVLTPTYTGCPATEAIRDDVRRVLQEAGYPQAEVQITLSPPWSSDWISARGRRRLREYGIAPPAGVALQASGQILRFMPRASHPQAIACPRCGSVDSEVLSEHGSTPCKALYRCRACREPFDYFKPY